MRSAIEAELLGMRKLSRRVPAARRASILASLLLGVSALLVVQPALSPDTASAESTLFVSLDSAGAPPAGPLIIEPGGTRSAYLFLETGPTASSMGTTACDDGDGDELCAIEFELEASAKMSIQSFSPEPDLDIAYQLSSNQLSANVIAGDSPLFGLQRLGFIVVSASPGPSVQADLEVGAGAVSAKLDYVELHSLPRSGRLMYVPEPFSGLSLLGGCGLLACLARRKSRRRRSGSASTLLILGATLKGLGGLCGTPAYADTLILSSGNSAVDTAAQSALQNIGIDSSIGPQFTELHDGSAIAGFSSILMFANANYNNGDMPIAGQDAIVSFVESGGGLITTEWFVWLMGYASRFQNLNPISPAQPTVLYSNAATLTYTIQSSDPRISNSLPASFTFATDSYGGTNTILTPRPGADSFASSSAGGSGAVGWAVGQGHVVSISSMFGPKEAADPNYSQFIANLVEWVTLDTDGDLVNDLADNCPLIANPDQTDSDLDGIGNLCDDDPDNDSLLATDNCPLVANPSQLDTNADGRGDACQCGDLNVDGTVDADDLQAVREYLLGSQTPADLRLCDVSGDGSVAIDLLSGRRLDCGLVDSVILDAHVRNSQTPLGDSCIGIPENPVFPGVSYAGSYEPDSIELEWLPATVQSGQAHYEIHLAASPGVLPTPSTLWLTTAPGAQSAALAGLTAGTQYFILVVAVDDQGVGSLERDYVDVRTARFETVVNPNETVARIADLNLTMPSETTNSLVFPDSPGAIAPAPGSILIGESDVGAFLRRVGSVSVGSGQIVVETIPASLSEVFDQLSYSLSINLDESFTEDVGGNSASVASPKAVSSSLSATCVQIPDSEITVCANSTNDVSTRIEPIFAPGRPLLNVDLTAGGNLKYELLWTGAQAGMRVRTTVESTGSGSISTTHNLFDRKVSRIGLVAGIPVYTTFQFAVDLDLAASFEADIEFTNTAYAAYAFSGGIEWTGSTWNTVTSPGTGLSAQLFDGDLTVKGNLQGSATLIPSVEVLLYEAAGGKVQIEPSLETMMEVTASTSMICEQPQLDSLDVNLSIAGIASVTTGELVEVIGLPLPDLPSATLFSSGPVALFGLPELSFVFSDPLPVTPGNNLIATATATMGANNPLTIDDETPMWRISPADRGQIVDTGFPLVAEVDCTQSVDGEPPVWVTFTGHGLLGELADQCVEKSCPVCGNGTVEIGEKCDDGNQIDNDDCTNDCDTDRECPRELVGTWNLVYTGPYQGVVPPNPIHCVGDQPNPNNPPPFGTGWVTSATLTVTTDEYSSVFNGQYYYCSLEFTGTTSYDPYPYSYDPNACLVDGLTGSGNDQVVRDFTRGVEQIRVYSTSIGGISHIWERPIQ